jgi:hypothetical protein
MHVLWAGGVTEAVHKWGKAMRNAYRLKRSPSSRDGAAVDPVGRSLGYWTDVSAGTFDSSTTLVCACPLANEAFHVEWSNL